MPSTFHSLKRNCPICIGGRSDCRQNIHSGLIHCRHNVLSAVGYKCVGEDKWGFYLWAVNDQRSHSEAEWEQLRRERAAQKKRRLKEEAEQYTQSLSVEERDRLLRKLHRQLGLCTKHRQALRERGLTDAQIDASLFFSISPFQEIIGINPRLAGVDLWGKKLLIPDSGIACPIWDLQGRIIGFQTRFDNATENKYKWPTSRSQKRPKGSTSHLQNGELPISCCRPVVEVSRSLAQGEAGIIENKVGTKVRGTEFSLSHTQCLQANIGLAEGFIKSYIAAQKLNQVVIGAAGGNWTASPLQLRSYLDALSIELNTKTVILYADAGAVGNPTVLRHYQRTIELLQEWGYEVKVAWWGQLTKEDPDIDELEDLEVIATITPEKFFSFSFCQNQQFDRTHLLDNPNDTKLNSEAYTAYCQQETEAESIEAAQAEERERLHEEQYNQRVAKAQRSLNSLTYPIDIALHQKFLPEKLIDQIPQFGIINLKARKGGGKSTLLKRLIALWKRQERPVVSITPRIALGREQAFKWEITWIDDSGVVGSYTLSQCMLRHEEALGLCWDSFWKVAERDWTNAVVIIDEAELGLSHLATSSTCEDRRAFILKGFEKSIQEVLATGGLVILSDADLTDIPCDYLKAIAPEASVFTICNTHKGDSWDIEFYFGKRGDVISRIKTNLELGIKTAIATDSQAEAEALERKFYELYGHARIIRIDSKITETEFGREFVKDPNKGILDTKPDLLIYTPSMGVGVSIEIDWFDEVIGLFFGALEPSQCRQMLARIRLPIPRIVWCSDARHDLSGCKSFLPEVIKQQMLHFHKETSLNVLDLVQSLASEIATSSNDVDMIQALKDALERLWDKDKQEWNNPHIDLYCKLKARCNFGMSQLAIQLYQELIEEGHQIVKYEGSRDSFSQEISAQKIESKLRLAAQRANAERITVEAAREIKNNPHATQEDRRKAERAFLQDALPGIELTAEFIYKATIENGGRWLSQHRLFWRMQNPDKVKVLDEKIWRNHLSRLMVYLPDIRTYSLMVQVLQDLGIPELINPNVEYCNDSGAVQGLLQRAWEMRRLIKIAFDLNITKNTEPIKLWGKLLEKIGLETELVARRLTTDGKQVRYYTVSEQSLINPERLAVLEAMNRKYQDLEVKTPETTTTANFEGCQIPSVNLNNSGEVANEEVDLVLETVTEVQEQGISHHLATPKTDAAIPLPQVEHPIVRYMDKLYRFLCRKDDTAYLLDIESNNSLNWFRQKFGCDVMVRFKDLVWE